MKFRANEKWLRFEIWWRGIVAGLLFGILIGAWSGRAYWFDSPRIYIVLTLGTFLGFAPSLVYQIAHGIYTFRQASKHRPDA